jgi:hypothetical protein
MPVVGAALPLGIPGAPIPAPQFHIGAFPVNGVWCIFCQGQGYGRFRSLVPAEDLLTRRPQISIIFNKLSFLPSRAVACAKRSHTCQFFCSGRAPDPQCPAPTLETLPAYLAQAIEKLSVVGMHDEGAESSSIAVLTQLLGSLLTLRNKQGLVPTPQGELFFFSVGMYVAVRDIFLPLPFTLRLPHFFSPSLLRRRRAPHLGPAGGARLARVQNLQVGRRRTGGSAPGVHRSALPQHLPQGLSAGKRVGQREMVKD